MKMSLYEARQDRATFSVNNDVGSARTFAAARNAAITNQQIANGDGILRVHRNKLAVLD
jgi:hypothetical protein